MKGPEETLIDLLQAVTVPDRCHIPKVILRFWSDGHLIFVYRSVAAITFQSLERIQVFYKKLVYKKLVL